MYAFVIELKAPGTPWKLCGRRAGPRLLVPVPAPKTRIPPAPTCPFVRTGLNESMERSSRTLLAPAAWRRGGALAGVAFGVLALLALAPRAAADSTAFATTLALSGKEPAGCGGLEEPCCLKRAARCGAAGLACLPLTGAQALRCHACGGEDQPACEGGLRGARFQRFMDCVAMPGGRAWPAAPGRPGPRTGRRLAQLELAHPEAGGPGPPLPTQS
jgi:hypothetical protein